MRDYIVNKLQAKTKKICMIPQRNKSEIVMEIIVLPDGKEITLVYDKSKLVISC